MKAREHIEKARCELVMAAVKLDTTGDEYDFGAWTSVQAAVAALDRLAEREHEEYQEREAERGELAGTPENMACFECTRLAGRDVHDPEQQLEREVIALGPIAEAHRDPTQTYRLSCGHTTI